MAINLTVLAGKRAKATIEYLGQACTVVYNPTVITSEWMEKAQKSDDAFIAAFVELITSWDIKFDTKTTVPLSAEGIKRVPMPLMREIYKTLVYGQAESVDEEGKASSAG